MYILSWFDGDTLHSICSGEIVSVIRVYYALNKNMKSWSNKDDCYFTLFLNGMALDPRKYPEYMTIDSSLSHIKVS